MAEAMILDAVRTPVGRYRGVLAEARPDDLCAWVIEAAVERNGIEPASVDEVYMGCTNAAGEDNRNVARMASLLAGLPVEVPGVTVNRLCASGLEAVNQAGRGNIEMVDTTIGWRFVNPRMEHSTESMGETGENVAERYGVSREDQDAFALESHRRAVAAAEAGRFDDEIVTVDVAQALAGARGARDRGSSREPVTVHADEGPRADASAEGLAKLRPAFREGGTVTAGNSSSINDGAACVVLASEEKAQELGKEPLARIVSVGAAGVDPAVMGIGPVPASRLALERAGLEPGDMDLVEPNEAFASQSLASMRELGIDHERLNVNGGAIALGHPLGCSGARLLATLVWELRRRGARYGLATMCIGVGQGLATVIENPAA